MRMNELLPQLWNLKKDQSKTIYTAADGTNVTATRTDKITHKDFGVGLAIPEKPEFRPTHVRLLFDLHLKRRSEPDKVEKLFHALEKTYGGEDPKKFLPELKDIDFKMKLDSAEVNLYYAQLLMVEQDFNYIPREDLNNHLVKVTKKNKREKPTQILAKINGKQMEKKVSDLNPPRDFLMRYIRRTLRDELENIDEIITGAVRRWPPKPQFKKRLLDGLPEPAPWILKLLEGKI